MIASQSPGSVASRSCECAPASTAFGHEHIELPGRRDGPPHEQLVVLRIAGVGVHVLGAAARLGDQLDGRAPALARILAHVAEHDVRALAREQQGDRAPDPARAAGDDRAAALEAAGAQLSSPFASPPSTSSVIPLM